MSRAVPPDAARLDILARLDLVEKNEQDDEVQQRLNREMEAFQRRLLQQSWDVQSTLSKPLNLEEHYAPPKLRERMVSPISSVCGPGQDTFGDMQAALQREQQELQQQLEEAARARHRGPATAAEETRPEAYRAARLARAAMGSSDHAELPQPAIQTRVGAPPSAVRPQSPRAPSIRFERDAKREAPSANRSLSPRAPRALPLRSPRGAAAVSEAAPHDGRGSPRRPASPPAGAAGSNGGGGCSGGGMMEHAMRATSARRQKVPPHAVPSASPRHQPAGGTAAATAGGAAVVRLRSPRPASPSPRSFSRRAGQERSRETVQTAAAAAAAAGEVGEAVAGEAAAAGLEGGGDTDAARVRRRRATPYPLHSAGLAGGDGAEVSFGVVYPEEAQSGEADADAARRRRARRPTPHPGAFAVGVAGCAAVAAEVAAEAAPFLEGLAPEVASEVASEVR